MAYIPTTWATGDTITATKMNKLEQGVANAGAVLIVNSNGNNQNSTGECGINESLDATFAQIYDALAAGIPVYIRRNVETDGPSADYCCCASLFSVLSAFKYNEDYRVYAVSNKGWVSGNIYSVGQPVVVTFSATGPSAYPISVANGRPTNVTNGF